MEQVFDWKRGYSAGARFGVGVKKGNLRKLDKLPAPLMQLKVTDSPTNGLLLLTQAEPAFNRMFFRDRKDKLLTIAWNAGPEQTVVIDEIVYAFPPQSILPLMVNQSFRFERPEAVIAWQFNREFYCIVDHDKEVSCVGFLFYGAPESFFVRLQPDDERKISLLFQVFVDEFGTVDPIQVEMLRMLLKRLIILVTRLAKEQFIDPVALPETSLTWCGSLTCWSKTTTATSTAWPTTPTCSTARPKPFPTGLPSITRKVPCRSSTTASSWRPNDCCSTPTKTAKRLPTSSVLKK